MNAKSITQGIKVAIYGGNGFVGTRVAEQLADEDTSIVCLSRTGHRPTHLENKRWSESVRWCKGDASQPDQKLITRADVIVCLVGSPPLPTFSKAAYDEQVFMNGTTCVNAIEAAAQAGVKKVILLGASIPFPIRTDLFGYAKGKRLALEAAQTFSQLSDEHSSVVLQPGAIYGKRYLGNGKVVRLDWFMAPLAKIMPWQFVSVATVAQRIAHAVTHEQPYAGKCTVIRNCDIKLD